MYSLIAYVAQLLLPVAALFSKKMSLFVKGRRGQFARMEAAISLDDRVVWIHASSMGEFEEVRPIVERIRNEHPEFKTVVTFFSPSGYEAYKNWKGADCVFYLPVDTPYNASRFIRIVHPEIAIFSITDYWFSNGAGYFHYGAHNTAHVFEAQVGYDFGFLALNWYTNFAGADGVTDDGDRAYSSYLALSVPFRLAGLDWSVDVGATPWATSFYNNGAGGFEVCDISIGASKEVKITDHYALPLFAKATWNPATEGAYFVFGVSF